MSDMYPITKQLREAIECGCVLTLSTAECWQLYAFIQNPSENDDPAEVWGQISEGARGVLRELERSGPGVPYPHEDAQLRWFGCIEDQPRMGGYAVRISQWGRQVLGPHTRQPDTPNSDAANGGDRG